MRRHVWTLAFYLLAEGLFAAAASADGSLAVGIYPDRRRTLTITVNHRTAQESRAAALAGCQRTGALDCQVLATFRNECFATAVTNVSNGYGADPGPDKASAQAAALAECNRHNPGLGCRVFQVHCDEIDVILANEARVREQAALLAQQIAVQQQQQAKLDLERRQQEQKQQLEKQALERRKEAEFATHLAGCERYDLEACYRISALPLNVPGFGITESMDRASRWHTRFNRALANAQTLARNIVECGAKKRLACDAALATSGISVEQRAHIEQLQAQLPWFDLDNPRDFNTAMLTLPIVGFAIFLFLTRLSPAANRERRMRDRQPRPLDRWAVAAFHFIKNFDASSMANLRTRITQLLTPVGLPLVDRRFSETTMVRTATPVPSQPQALPAIMSVTPQPTAPEPILDTATAHAALALAHAYLSELPADFASEIIDNPTSADGHRSTLALAAKQLDIARRADPTAKLVVDGENGTPISLSQQLLRARTLQLEGISWCVHNPRRQISLLTQATEVDPSYAPAHHSLGAALFVNRSRGQAIAALQKALALDPGNMEIIKLLDRASNMSDAEIATYHLSNAAAKTAAAGIKTWSIIKLLWVFGLPIGIVLIVAQFTGSMSNAVLYIALFFAASAAFAFMRKAKDWFTNL